MNPISSQFRCRLWLAGLLAALALGPLARAAEAPLPDIRELMREVEAHQKQLETVRENYTYNAVQTVQD
ncbi:MAG: hypothetical protein WBE38_22170, partial [Terracidiphilus sp.]